MNPLTQIKNTQKATMREIESGMGESASWHERYKHSAYVFAGGLPFNMTEGDILAVFSQFGEIVDVNLVRHEETGKSRGFAFICYADQRSTVLAVDNLNGGTVVGRTIRVDHVDDYRKTRATRREKSGGASADLTTSNFEIHALNVGPLDRWRRRHSPTRRMELMDRSRERPRCEIAETWWTPLDLATRMRRMKTHASFGSFKLVKPPRSPVLRLLSKDYRFQTMMETRGEGASVTRRRRRRRKRRGKNELELDSTL